MKILKIFGIVAGIHALAFLLILANPGCSSTSKPPPAPANAESIALKIADYEGLIAVLKHEKKTDQVTQLLEESARFDDAAKAFYLRRGFAESPLQPLTLMLGLPRSAPSSP